jgi:hypothetical protein
MKIVYLVFSVICLAGVYFYYTPSRSAETDKCENVFASGVAADYYGQLGFAIPEGAKERRAFHEGYISTLRNDPLEHAKAVFMGTNLTKAYQEFLSRHIPPYQSGDFIEYLENSLKKLRAISSFSGLKHNSPYDDSLMEGNLPFLQFGLEDVAVVRMAMPVVDGNRLFSASGIHPEFLTFVRGQKKHLYVNLMKRHGTEGPLSKALEALDGTESTLAVVTLDKNSPFYWQEGDFPESAPAFKELFLNRMLEGKDYYWSSQLDMEKWKTDLKQCLNHVHLVHFHENPLLNRKEREDFIELAYLEILDGLVASLQPESLNITCKQAMDRAPSLAVLWQWKLGLAAEQEAAALLFAPPLLVHNRPTHRSRLARFISSLQFFYSNK